MLAAQLRAPNDMTVSEVPMPKAGDGEFVMKVKAASICGTDVRIYRGKKTKGIRYPSTIGHEFSGEIVEIGNGVKSFAVGDRVSVDPVIPCHGCAYCLRGMENVCANRTAIGYEYEGAFAEYILIPKPAVEGGHVYKIPEGVSWGAAALAEPLACCINGQEKVNIQMGDTVVVIGTGPIGLMQVKLAKAKGAGTVIVSELHDHRRQTALDCGADIAVNPEKADLDAVVKSATDGIGADVVIMAIGIPSLVKPAIALARKGGRVSLFAGFTAGVSAEIDPNVIHYNELIVTGASALKRSDYATAVQMVAKKEFGADQLISHEFSLQEIDKAFEIAEAGTSSIKVVITP